MITMIILIILAGIVINVIFGSDGLIEKAKLAADEYNNSAAKENTELQDLEYQIDMNSRDTVTIPKDEYEKLKKDATTLVVTCTTVSSTTWGKIAEYPSGYSINDVYIKSFQIQISSEEIDTAYTDIALQLRPEGIYQWTNSNARYSKPITVYLGLK